MPETPGAMAAIEGGNVINRICYAEATPSIVKLLEEGEEHPRWVKWLVIAMQPGLAVGPPVPPASLTPKAHHSSNSIVQQE